MFPPFYPLQNEVDLENLVFPMISAAGVGVAQGFGGAVSLGSCFSCLNLCQGSIFMSSGIP